MILGTFILTIVTTALLIVLKLYVFTMIPVFALFIPFIIFSIFILILLVILGVVAYITIKKFWNEIKKYLGN